MSTTARHTPTDNADGVRGRGGGRGGRGRGVTNQPAGFSARWGGTINDSSENFEVRWKVLIQKTTPPPPLLCVCVWGWGWGACVSLCGFTTVYLSVCLCLCLSVSLSLSSLSLLLWLSFTLLPCLDINRLCTASPFLLISSILAIVVK